MKLVTVAATAAIVLAGAGCGSSGGEPGSGATITVVASTNVWGSVVQAVGGAAVTVRALVGDPAADPHAAEAKPEDAAALAEAKLVVFNGGGYDPSFADLASGTGAPRIEAFALSGRSTGNEHVWYDLPTVKAVADKVAEELAVIDPARKESFAGNARSFTAKLDDLSARVAGIGAGADVVATEPVAGYLIEAAGLTDLTPPEFSEAIEEETDPPAAAVAEITELVSSRRVAAVINNGQTETPVTNSLKDTAGRSGVPVVDVTETLPQGVTDYVDWMTTQVDALARALAKP